MERAQLKTKVLSKGYGNCEGWDGLSGRGAFAVLPFK